MAVGCDSGGMSSNGGIKLGLEADVLPSLLDGGFADIMWGRSSLMV